MDTFRKRYSTIPQKLFRHRLQFSSHQYLVSLEKIVTQMMLQLEHHYSWFNALIASGMGSVISGGCRQNGVKIAYTLRSPCPPLRILKTNR